jgi:hypothetical protein
MAVGDIRRGEGGKVMKHEHKNAGAQIASAAHTLILE